MIEEDFDIEVRPDNRTITITHRSYDDIGSFNSHAKKWEKLIATDIQKAVKDVSIWLGQYLHERMGKAGYEVRIVTKNPAFGKKWVSKDIR